MLVDAASIISRMLDNIAWCMKFWAFHKVKTLSVWYLSTTFNPSGKTVAPAPTRQIGTGRSLAGLGALADSGPVVSPQTPPESLWGDEFAFYVSKYGPVAAGLDVNKFVGYGFGGMNTWDYYPEPDYENILGRTQGKVPRMPGLTPAANAYLASAFYPVYPGELARFFDREEGAEDVNGRAKVTNAEGCAWHDVHNALVVMGYDLSKIGPAGLTSIRPQNLSWVQAPVVGIKGGAPLWGVAAPNGGLGYPWFDLLNPMNRAVPRSGCITESSREGAWQALAVIGSIVALAVGGAVITTEFATAGSAGAASSATLTAETEASFDASLPGLPSAGAPVIGSSAVPIAAGAGIPAYSLPIVLPSAGTVAGAAGGVAGAVGSAAGGGGGGGGLLSAAEGVAGGAAKSVAGQLASAGASELLSKIGGQGQSSSAAPAASSGTSSSTAGTSIWTWVLLGGGIIAAVLLL